MSAVTAPIQKSSRLGAFLARAFTKPAFVVGFAILMLSLALGWQEEVAASNITRLRPAFFAA